MEQSEGFLSLPLAGSDPADRAEMAWQRDRMEWRDVKQADVVMLMALLEREFSLEERRGSYNLYEPLTRHLSSLSEAVHSLVARRVGFDAAADDYFIRAVAIDLFDSRGNRPEGLHMATQGGLWQAVVLGCGGLSVTDGVLHLDPRLATGWNRLRFSLTHQGVPATVDTDADHRHGGSGRRVRSMLPCRGCAQPRAPGTRPSWCCRTAAGTCRGERPVALARCRRPNSYSRRREATAQGSIEPWTRWSAPSSTSAPLCTCARRSCTTTTSCRS